MEDLGLHLVLNLESVRQLRGLLRRDLNEEQHDSLGDLFAVLEVLRTVEKEP